MSEESIPVGDLARQFGRRKQTVFKVLRRLRIEPRKLGSSDQGGQLVSYISAQESVLVAAELRSAEAPFGCKQLHTEVFRAQSIEPVLKRCEQFFNLMPQLREADK